MEIRNCSLRIPAYFYRMGIRFLITAIMLVCTVWLGYYVTQSDFMGIMIGIVPFFAAYAWVIKRDEAIIYWILIGILLRILLLFSLPNLSDDYFRFYWDGLLTINGYNPFNRLPDYYLQNHILPEYLTPDLYERLNSKPYYTIYPPVLQGIFAAAAWFFPKNIGSAVLFMKLILLLSEIGALLLLKKLLPLVGLPGQQVLLYALNPLIIIEIVGNLHFEGLMIFFLLLALWLLLHPIRRGWLWSAAVMAGAVATKLLPLLFLPFLIAHLGWRRSFIYFSTIGIILLGLFTPLFNSLFFKNFGSSLDLYFRRFEFNAGLFYFLKGIASFFTDRNPVKIIGPGLALLTFLLVITLAIWRRKKDLTSLPESWLWAISIYLFNTTTVHPWYLSTPVALSVLSQWRYAIMWSGAAWLSYSHYQGGNFAERYEFIIIEYALIVIYFLWEVWINKNRQHQLIAK